ncbi:ABC transporter ATP-binding protein [Paenibacillus spongiae]|uniref:ATP-binding cassette domain-containing protein n=1 Tax=Paenibacillus spongiae TaxID=2909671 RepID=A0ABY5SDH4_9BACL|nr:ATP-binding cassette domain-containing protein [Paenibacillus spongiae]UVI31580.1 ATP-binding cassette domain-containing protein [Paenibacillus spongiae]
MTVLLAMENITKHRQDDASKILFERITAEIAAGQHVALLGGSGQGKSTLLRIIARLERCDAGEIALHSKPIAAWKPQDWRRKVCYVAQQAVMLPGTVEQNLRTASELHGLPFHEALAKRCMEAVGLGAVDWQKPAADLSGGEKQRTALVRAMLLSPDVLLLDEVTASLDPGSKRLVERCLSEWAAQEEKALIWVTHDLEQAKQVSDTVWFMAEGKLLEHCETAVFFDCPSTDQARRYLQQSRKEEESV